METKKELTIEEKAQRYDEAIKIAKKWYNKTEPDSYTCIVESIFPELKESDDESIKNWIKKELESKYVVDNTVNNAMADKALAWLEKQVDTNKEYWRGYREGKQEIIDKYSELENQGKQKSAVNTKVFIPNFNVGDWIVDAIDTVYQIKEIKEDRYLLQLYNSNDVISSKISTIDNDCHLWTIQDAKAGDVLVYKGNIKYSNDIKYSNGIKYERMCLFNNLDNAFFTLTKTSNYVEEYDVDINIDYPDNTVPATKEQKEILFMAMANAGYTFDFEKKELKKIEQKPTYKEGDWLVHNERRNIIKVVNATPLVYEGVDILGYHNKMSNTTIENNYHLWSIADAKAGDVVVEDSNISNPSSPFIAIFKKKDSEDDFSSHCFIGFDGYFYDGEAGHCSENIHPATKEHRDLLFQKMKEAGYEWDAEKKELKKIIYPVFKIGDTI